MRKQIQQLNFDGHNLELMILVILDYCDIILRRNNVISRIVNFKKVENEKLEDEIK